MANLPSKIPIYQLMRPVRDHLTESIDHDRQRAIGIVTDKSCGKSETNISYMSRDMAEPQ